MNVKPGADASKVIVSGPGVENDVPASMPVTFTIDTRNAGAAPLEVVVQVCIFINAVLEMKYC